MIMDVICPCVIDNLLRLIVSAPGEEMIRDENDRPEQEKVQEWFFE